jgi:hypothetical protein
MLALASAAIVHACSCLRSDAERLCARQDEPTSGLDAFNAQSVMSSLKLLASTGRAIVACIHQPRSGITALFDALLLLSEGRVMFSGAAPACLAFLGRCGFACPEHTNPADFYLDVVSVSFSSPEAETASRARVALLADAYAAERDEQLRALRQAAPAMEPAAAVPAGSRAVAEGVVAVQLDGGANGDYAAKHDDSSSSNNNNGKEPADVRRPTTLVARLRRRGVEWRALGRVRAAWRRDSAWRTASTLCELSSSRSCSASSGSTLAATPPARPRTCATWAACSSSPSVRSSATIVHAHAGRR